MDKTQCPHCLGFLEEFDPDTEKATPCFLCNGSGEVTLSVQKDYVKSLTIVQDDREELTTDE